MRTARLITFLGRALSAAALVAFASLAGAQTVLTTVSVPGQSGPWSQSANSSNTALAKYGAQPYGQYSNLSYATGAPVAVSLSTYGLAAGATLTLTCTGGSASDGNDSSGCAGDTAYSAENATYQAASICASYYPSASVSAGSYPIYTMQLIGDFATASGVVVGAPFLITSSGASVTVPAGASQVQLGFNDCYFPDNSGALSVQLTTTASYSWSASGFSACTPAPSWQYTDWAPAGSASCGASTAQARNGSCSPSAGTQTQTVTCTRSDGTTVSNSFCSGTAPVTSQSCTAACPTEGAISNTYTELASCSSNLLLNGGFEAGGAATRAAPPRSVSGKSRFWQVFLNICSDVSTETRSTGGACANTRGKHYIAPLDVLERSVFGLRGKQKGKWIPQCLELLDMTRLIQSGRVWRCAFDERNPECANLM